MNRMHAGRRRGLTLIELVVVLLILAALAAIIVPMLRGFVEKSHGAEGSTNIGELAKWFESYKVQYLRPSANQPTPGYPNRLDSLVTTGGASLYSQLSAELSPRLVLETLDAGQAASLANAGLTHLFDHRVAADFPTTAPFEPSATFNDEVDGHYATAIGLPRLVAGGGGVALLDPAVAASLGLEPGTYAVFGVGDRCAAVGKSMLNAPVHFLGNNDPNDVYARYVVIFQIPATGQLTGTTSNKAKFMGVLTAHGESLGGMLGEFHKAQE